VAPAGTRLAKLASMPGTCAISPRFVTRDSRSVSSGLHAPPPALCVVACTALLFTSAPARADDTWSDAVPLASAPLPSVNAAPSVTKPEARVPPQQPRKKSLSVPGFVHIAIGSAGLFAGGLLIVSCAHFGPPGDPPANYEPPADCPTKLLAGGILLGQGTASLNIGLALVIAAGIRARPAEETDSAVPTVRFGPGAGSLTWRF
jgi:hypothetical protein